jgi:hypothetical protein
MRRNHKKYLKHQKTLQLPSLPLAVERADHPPKGGVAGVSQRSAFITACALAFMH